MRQISQFRLSQADIISAKQAELQNSIAVLIKQKSIKQNLIENKQVEYEAYNKEEARGRLLVWRLCLKEAVSVKKVSKLKKFREKKIQKVEIERIIADELKKSTNKCCNRFCLYARSNKTF